MSEQNVNSQAANSFWDDYEKDAQSESGGGGIIATVKIATVYKGFVSGLDQSEAYRDVPVGASKEVKDAAKAALMELGADKADYGVQIIVYRDNAVSRGKPVTWQADRYFFQSSWNDACKSVVVPSLKECGIFNLPFTGWARIGFKPNPFNVAQGDAGKTDTDKEGNLRFPQVAYIVDVFANEDEARAAIGGEASESTAAAPADKHSWMNGTSWTAETWETDETQKSLYDAYNDAKTPPQKAKLAVEWEAPLEVMKKAVTDYIPL